MGRGAAHELPGRFDDGPGLVLALRVRASVALFLHRLLPHSAPAPRTARSRAVPGEVRIGVAEVLRAGALAHLAGRVLTGSKNARSEWLLAPRCSLDLMWYNCDGGHEGQNHDARNQTG